MAGPRAARGGSRGTRGDGTAAASPAPGPPVDEGAFEKLKAWRYERAEGKPAYTVATNAALEEIVRRRPRHPQALLAIRGIGPAFCEKHGQSLLAELATL